MREKRIHHRFQLIYPLYCHRQKSRTPFYCVFENISKEGMKIFTEKILENNERIRFNFKLLGNIIKGEGKIVWYKASLNRKSHSAGIKFTKIEPKVKINLSKCLQELSTA